MRFAVSSIELAPCPKRRSAAPHAIIWLMGKFVRSYTQDLDFDASRIHPSAKV